MSLQWTFIATFLYSEIFLVLLLLLPFISPPRWQRIFKSRLLNSFSSYSHIYFNIFIVVLVLLFIDAIRDVKRYGFRDEQIDVHAHPNAEVNLQMKLFRAQRNLYIAGFALFLWLVLRRLVTLISTQATLMAEHEAALKQAQSATETAKRLLNEQDEHKGNPTSTSEDDSSDLKEELEKTKEELHKAQLDLDTMKKQAESTNKEYDRLMHEHEGLQAKLKTLEGDGDKKDD